MTKGIKYDGEKPRWSLVPTKEIEQVVEILTFGAQKYADDNWKTVKPFHDRYYSALMRHLAAREDGEIIDKDSKKPHLAHVATNAIFLLYGDNNKIDIRDKKIGLDIDEVLADYINHHIKHYKKNDAPVNRASYGLYYGFYEDFKPSLKDKDYWLSMPVLTSPKELFFEPECYITQRLIPTEWTEEWLAKNGFPIKPVITITGDKGAVCKQRGLDIYIEDKVSNFIDITNHGVKCFLFDRPHNQFFDAGGLRISKMNQIF